MIQPRVRELCLCHIYRGKYTLHTRQTEPRRTGPVVIVCRVDWRCTARLTKVMPTKVITSVVHQPVITAMCTLMGWAEHGSRRNYTYLVHLLRYVNAMKNWPPFHRCGLAWPDHFSRVVIYISSYLAPAFIPCAALVLILLQTFGSLHLAASTTPTRVTLRLQVLAAAMKQELRKETTRLTTTVEILFAQVFHRPMLYWTD